MTTLDALSKGGLSRVTPSAWLNLRQCAWQVLLARHFHNKPLLPVHPNATLGSILHTALEKITKGELKTKEDFNCWWDEKVKQSEHDLSNKGWGQFVPLKENTRHFGLKKVQVRNRLLALQTNQPLSAGTVTRVAEKKLATSDGLLTGQLDCIIWREGQAEIRDYKTGVITVEGDGAEITSIIKEEYQLQMKLYACLFREAYGMYPTRLVLEDLNGVGYEVKFTPEECLNLLEEVKSFLEEINWKIATGDWEGLTNPGEYCTFCTFRPACRKYISTLESTSVLPNKGWHDLSGILTSCEEKGISGLVLQIQRMGGNIMVAGFEARRRTELTELLNQKIAIFNVKMVDTQKYFCTKFTDFYAI